MATLTQIDMTPADQPELNAAEQEALAVGEQAAADQQQMLAGKFKDAEALEQAYIELQKKLGESNDSEETEEVRDEDTSSEEVEVSVAQLITDASQSLLETGELTPEVMEQFNSMSSSELVQAYMEMQGNLPQSQSPSDLTDAEVNQIKNYAGGEEGYTQLMQWVRREP